MENLLSTLKSVSEVIDDFRHGNTAIPEIQRDVVWTADQVKNLVDSISRGFPCGSLIFWEPREKDAQLVRSMIRPERLKALNGRLPRYFLLDGQQRVTALASVLLKRDSLKTLLAELDEELPFVFANLKRFPREFETTTDPANYKYPWVLFNRLFDGSYRNDPEFAKVTAQQVEQVQEYVQQLRDYKFPVQIIRDRNYGTVGEIFTRVNSEGTQLTGAEIHLARIVPHWNGITKEFRDYRRELRQKNYDLDLTFLMRAVTVTECSVPQIKKLADKIAKDRPSKGHLRKTWTAARSAVDRMIRILQKDLHLDKSKYIVSKNALVPPLYALAQGNGSRRVAKAVSRFFVLSQLSERYSAAAETALRKDFRLLTDGADTPAKGLLELVQTVNRDARQYYRGLKIKAEDVSGFPSRNVFLLLMYVLMRERGATDWGSQRPLRLNEIDPSSMQLHHIFPFDYMVKNKAMLDKFLDEGYTPADYRGHINDISNLTFLSQAKNGSIGDAPPAQYLAIETTKEMRRAHFIPESKELWKTERFPDFLEERSRMIAESITKFLKRI